MNQDDEAVINSQEALKRAEASNNNAHITQIKSAIETHANKKINETLDDFLPYLKNVLSGVGQIAEDEIRDQNGDLDVIYNSFLSRVQLIGYEWNMKYVPVIAELLSFYSPEAVFHITSKTVSVNPKIIDNILNALLYLISNSEGVMQHDASHLLALNIISPLDSNRIRNTYRMGILTTSAAATDGLSKLDDIMRNELRYIHPSLPSLIADQEPINEKEIEFAKSKILPKFELNIKSTVLSKLILFFIIFI